MEQGKQTSVFGGTSGWSYDDWVGPFYPERTEKGFSRLRFYADFFDCVEVNSTFYRHFPPSVGEKWLKEVGGNQSFVFIIKLYNEFTHGGRERGRAFDDNKKIVVSFLRPFAEREKLGGVLVQFSEYFKDNPASRDHISCLIDEFGDFQLFFELRHTSWYRQSSREFLSGRNANIVAVDQPVLKGMAGFDPEVSGTIGYFRLHGRNTEMWELSQKNLKERGRLAESDNAGGADRNRRYNYMYGHAELDEIEKKILRVKERCDRIYVIANNHPLGKAVANALELVRRLRNQERIKMPETLIKYFPELQTIAERVDVGPIGDLF